MVSEWIDRVAQLREDDRYFSAGRWTGYGREPGNSSPMKGVYFLVRVATPRSTPNVAISGNDQEALIEWARRIEHILTGGVV